MCIRDRYGIPCTVAPHACYPPARDPSSGSWQASLTSLRGRDWNPACSMWHGAWKKRIMFFAAFYRVGLPALDARLLPCMQCNASRTSGIAFREKIDKMVHLLLPIAAAPTLRFYRLCIYLPIVYHTKHCLSSLLARPAEGSPNQSHRSSINHGLSLIHI